MKKSIILPTNEQIEFNFILKIETRGLWLNGEIKGASVEQKYIDHLKCALEAEGITVEEKQ